MQVHAQEQECHVAQGYSAQQQMNQQQYVQPLRCCLPCLTVERIAVDSSAA